MPEDKSMNLLVHGSSYMNHNLCDILIMCTKQMQTVQQIEICISAPWFNLEKHCVPICCHTFQLSFAHSYNYLEMFYTFKTQSVHKCNLIGKID